jgi:hypothetical protein
MRYLVQRATGYDLDAYEDYLREARPTLAARVHGDGLLDLERNGLDRRSLHDARLVGLTVDAEGAVELVLRGAWYDRTFHLRYEGVRACAVQLPRPTDDLLVHEVRAEGDGVVHELAFDHGRGVEVTCATLTFTERAG